MTEDNRLKRLGWEIHLWCFLCLCMLSTMSSATASFAAYPTQGPSVKSNPSAITRGTFNLSLDDGSYEDTLGNMLDGEFIWLNQFSVNPRGSIVTLEQVQVLFPSGQGINVGELVDIYLYMDPDGDGDPATGAVLQRSIKNAEVQAVDGVIWSSYNLTSPLRLNNAGDLLVAVVNRTAGTDFGEQPAALDQTASQGRSWLGINMSGVISDPPVFPADIIWGTVDSLGSPGNWMIRVSGESLPKPIPSLSVIGIALLTLMLSVVVLWREH